MKVLIGCEFSGIVRDAFIERGHDAMSCDLLPTERPGPHYQGDIMDVINDGWDMMIAFPPCTYLSYAGESHFKQDPNRQLKRDEAANFFRALYNARIEKIALENPRGIMSKWIRETQEIQPFLFGDPYRKRTLLWLKNLPPLIFGPINPKGIFPEKYLIRKGKFRNGGRRGVYFTDKCTGTDRQHLRSKTFPGIARAMAEQWG